MKTINFILVLLLLISSCEYENGNITKSRGKRALNEEKQKYKKHLKKC
ncbi:hypothetical protein [Borrelia hermsii]